MQRQAKDGGSFIVENRESFRGALTGGCWCEEAIGRLIRSGTSNVYVWHFLVGPKLEMGRKIREAVSY